MEGKYLLVLLLCLVVQNSMADFCMQDHIGCFDKQLDKYLNDQIQAELQAQMTYLTLAQKFDSYDNYYPKIAAFLRAKSAEELTHAERFIEYQNQRGGKFDFSSVQTYTCSENSDTITGALQCALELETRITAKLTALQSNVQSVGKLSLCQDVKLDEEQLLLSQPIMVKLGETKTTLQAFEDCRPTRISLVKLEYVELAEMIAHEFLSHQVKDIKELANMYMTVKNIAKGNKPGLANYLFDQHLEL